ncbi:hypothetical protein MHH93_08620 [Priestia sp. FSL H7-0729]
MKTNKKLSVRALFAITLSVVMLMVTACSSQGASGGNEKDAEGNYKDNLTISVANLTEIKNGNLDNDFHKFWTDKFNVTWDYNYID